MIGDVIFFKKDKDSFISKAIAKMTKSNYSHVGIIIGYDKFNNVVTVIESNRFVNTRVILVELNKCKHTIYTTGEKSRKQIDLIRKLSYKAIGIKYDYMQTIGLIFSLLLNKRENAWFNSKNKLICSELIDIVYYKSGIKRSEVYSLGNVTPQELFEVYDFRIKKGV